MKTMILVSECSLKMESLKQSKHLIYNSKKYIVIFIVWEVGET